jgi:hypothetical protein
MGGMDMGEAMSHETSVRAEFEEQAQDLAEVCEKLRPGTGAAIETFVRMAYATGHAAGMARMREMAAEVADGYNQFAAEAIRALPCAPGESAAGAEGGK